MGSTYALRHGGQPSSGLPTEAHARLASAERRLAEREGFEPSVEFPLHTLSKRAPSTTRTSLRLESMICGRSGSDYRKTLLQILVFRDAVCIQRFADAPRSIDAETVSDLLMSSDHLRRFSSISITADSAAGLGNRAVPTEMPRPSASSHFAPSATARRVAVTLRSSHPNVGGPLPGLTTSSQMEPDALDRLCHSVDGMDKRTERVAL